MSEQIKSDRLFKFILKCQRNHNKLDLHSFMIDIEDGRAFVDCRSDGVCMQTYYNNGSSVCWSGTAVAAANRLEMLGADYETIDM
jgi:hypothetical protein